MRFVLDQDVDARVRTVLIKAGHEAWTVGSAGLSEASDDDITLYAQRKDAVVVTHDREFSRRRRRAPIGRHLHLDCRERAARDVVAAKLVQILDCLEPFEDVYVRASVDEVAFSSTWAP